MRHQRWQDTISLQWQGLTLLVARLSVYQLVHRLVSMNTCSCSSRCSSAAILKVLRSLSNHLQTAEWVDTLACPACLPSSSLRFHQTSLSCRRPQDRLKDLPKDLLRDSHRDHLKARQASLLTCVIPKALQTVPISSKPSSSGNHQVSVA